MIYFLRTTALLHGRRIISVASSSSSSLLNLQFSPVSLLVLSRKCFSNIAEKAAQHVHFKTHKNADSVIAFLKDRDLSETQIFTIIRKFPAVLACNPCKTLLPKFDFFYSKGISSHELAEILCVHPYILKSNVKKQLLPSFDLVADMLKSKEKTFDAIKRYGGILCRPLKADMIPNISILSENGVPESNILNLLRYQPRTFMIVPDRFRETVEEVKGMGFNPLKLSFMLAIHVLTAMSETTWLKKVECYKKWGWSDEDIMLAFKRNPWCMALSEKKITEGINYFTNVMGLHPLFICNLPSLLGLSLNKRIVPRGSVGKVLLSKGLIEERSISSLFYAKEELFLKKFVHRYENEAPHLLKLYTEKLNLSKECETESKCDNGNTMCC